ncbi:MAG: hypothetical protein J5931_09305 [Prevotella sp.]|jgi:RNase H-fold protein (predicted Holliday junction resolvase)|nr:hypothetical protein [Prevotella sp.]
MKQFLKTLIGFGILLLLMCIIIEVALLFRPNVYAYKRQYMDQHAKDIKVLLLGSSHIEEAVKPELVGEGTFNLAISARLREYDVALAEIYVPRMDSLQAVVVPVDYTNFFFERQHENPLTKSIPEDLSGTCRCMHTKYMGTRIDPFWYFSEILNSKLNYMSRFWNNRQKLQECDSLGYVKLDIKERLADWDLRSIPAVIDTTKTIDKPSYDEMYGQYEQLAKVTWKKQVRLVLVATPVYKTYQESIHPVVLNDIHVFVQKLQKSYPHVEYHENLFDDRFTADDFQDASHLTEAGAVKYSKILSAIIHP